MQIRWHIICLAYKNSWVRFSALHKPGDVGHTYTPNSGDMDVGESVVQDHPKLHRKIVARMHYMRQY